MRPISRDRSARNVRNQSGSCGFASAKPVRQSCAPAGHVEAAGRDRQHEVRDQCGFVERRAHRDHAAHRLRDHGGRPVDRFQHMTHEAVEIVDGRIVRRVAEARVADDPALGRMREGRRAVARKRCCPMRRAGRAVATERAWRCGFPVNEVKRKGRDASRADQHRPVRSATVQSSRPREAAVAAAVCQSYSTAWNSTFQPAAVRDTIA